MRTALAALLILAAPAAVLAANPYGKASPSPTATAAPEKKEKTPPPEPGRNECVATAEKDGAVLGTSTGDYQACLRDLKAQVAAKCDGTAKQIPFVLHRGGQKPITTAAICD